MMKTFFFHPIVNFEHFQKEYDGDPDDENLLFHPIVNFERFQKEYDGDPDDGTEN